MSANPGALETFRTRQRWQEIAGSGRPAELKVAVLASFTADLLVPFLGVALEDSGLPAQLWVGPYNQILQECLSPESRTADFGPDWVVAWPRLEELWSGRPLPWDGTADYHREALQTADACCAAAERWSARLLFVLPAIPEERPLGAGDAGNPCGVAASAAAVREALRQRLAGRPGVIVADLEMLVRELGSARAYNPAMLVFAHVPFSDELFRALGDEIARLVALHRGYGRRVLVLDADDTLWGGRLDELGAAGVDLASGGPGLAFRHFQSYLLERRRAGLELALVNAAAPEEVGRALARPEMRLREPHLAAVEAGSPEVPAQLAAIAARLDAEPETLALVTAAEAVRAAVAEKLPRVATVTMPEDPARWLAAIRESHVLDALPPPVRLRARDETVPDLSLEGFLASLGLEVTFSELEPESAQHVVDMQQKISELNLAAATRSADEIADELRRGTASIWDVRVRDRFDDYGSAGLCRRTRAGEALEVDTLALDCRVLGKRVEGCLVAELVAAAEAQGLSRLRFRYRPTPRNAPALDLLRQIDAEALAPWEDGWVLEVPVAQAAEWARRQRAALAASPAPESPAAETPPPAAPAPSPAALQALLGRSRAAALQRLGDDLCSGEAVLAAMRSARRRRPGAERGAGELVPAHGPVEELLVGAWSELLGRAPIGVYDHFFRLGGNSLLATRLLSRVRDAFGVELPLKSCFEAPTPAALARRIEAARRDGASPGPPAIEPRPRVGSPPLSFAQRRLWAVEQLEPGNTAYNMQVGLRVRGRLDRGALAAALAALVARHESLRTSFRARGEGEPVQVVAREVAATPRFADLTALAAETRSRALRRIAGEEVRRPFELSRAPLFRLALVRFDAEDHALLLTIHHLIADAWSLGVFCQELVAQYAAAVAGRPSPFAPLPIQVPDFAAWQRQWLAGEVLAAHVEFWRRQLAGAPTVLELPADHPRPAALSFRNGHLALALPAASAERARKLGERYGATLFMTLFGAFAALLGHDAGQRDLLIGTPIANRTRPELEPLIGFIANTLVLRVDLTGRPGFAALLKRVREHLLAALDYQDMPFETLVRELKPPRDASRNPVFQVMFAFHNVPQPQADTGGLCCERIDLEQDLNPFDLFLHLWEDADGSLAGNLSYSLDLFTRASMERLADHYCTVLEAVTEAPEEPLESLFEARGLGPAAAAPRGAGSAPGQRPPAAAYAAPRNPAEETLAAIWAEALQRPRVGIHDNFFDHGGDSILAIQTIVRANQAGLALVPSQMLRHQTIAALAAVAGTAAAVRAEQGLVTGPVPLTPSQSEYFERGDPDPHHFNHTLLLALRQRLEVPVIVSALSELLAHHDALRLRFEPTAGGWEQTNAGREATRPPFSLVDLSAVGEEVRRAALENAAVQVGGTLDLSRGPLLRVVLFRQGHGRGGRLLIVLHHLVVDGFSWRLILSDFHTLSRQIAAGERPRLPPKTTSFKALAERLREHARSASLRSELDYWLTADSDRVRPLPVDVPGGDNSMAFHRGVALTLSREETRSLRYEVSRALETQLDEILLAALVQAFEPWTGCRSLRVDLIGANRPALFEDVDLSRTVGWISSTYPVHLDLGEIEDPLAELRSVRETLRRLPNRGIGYGLLRYLSGDDEAAARLSARPRPEVLFTYWGEFDQVRADVSDSFEAADEDVDRGSYPPRRDRLWLIGVSIEIADERLTIQLNYSAGVHRRATIERLAESYGAALRAIIAAGRGGEEETPDGPRERGAAAPPEAVEAPL